jgi:hypothetical protein
MTIPNASTQAAIRRIFGERRAYTLAEAADLIGVEREALDRQVDAGELATVGSEPRLPWAEVAYLALRRWPLKAILDALGSEPSSLLPALLRPTELTVSLPAYQVRMLEVLASHEQLDASTFLQGQLLDLASASDHALLEEQIPGFLEAFFFPHER